MKKNELDGFRNQLLQLERDFKGEVSTLEDEAFRTNDQLERNNFSNIPVEDRAGRAFDNYSEETTIGLIENADARLREITASIDRIDQGIFGICEECSKEIPIDRLRALPFARRCIHCARKAQQGELASPGNL